VKNRAACLSRPVPGKYDTQEGILSIRILIAESHPNMRDTLRSLIEKEPGLEVAAETGNGQRTLELAREIIPDIVILDTHLPDVGGAEAARRIKAESPGTGVIAFSMHNDRRYAAGMLDAGASGYLVKDFAFEELVRAVRTVADHRTYLCPVIKDRKLLKPHRH
jgi:DNA-binding NarL/FixJ family response regulator